MDIFITILLYILYIIISIIGILLIFIILMLIFPFKFYGSISKDDKINAIVKMTWLMHIFSMKYEYNENYKDEHYNMKYYIIGIDINKLINKFKKPKIKKKVNKDEAKNKDEIENDFKENDGIEQIKKEFENNEKYENNDKLSQKKYTKKVKRNNKKTKSKKNLNVKKVKFIDKFKKYMKIYKILKVDALETIKVLFKSIKLRIYNLKLHFGFEDRAKTGQVLGVLAAVLGIFAIESDIKPDFEDKVLEGSIDFEFKIILWIIVKYILKYLFIYRKIKKTILKMEVVNNEQ